MFYLLCSLALACYFTYQHARWRAQYAEKLSSLKHGCMCDSPASWPFAYRCHGHRKVEIPTPLPALIAPCVMLTLLGPLGILLTLGIHGLGWVYRRGSRA